MEKIVSNELLKLVLPCPQNQFVDFIKENDDYIKYGARVQDQISVYELAHLCKKWAYKQGYLLDSRTTMTGSCFLLTSPCSPNEDIYKTFVDKTEVKAIYKAIEWLRIYLIEQGLLDENI